MENLKKCLYKCEQLPKGWGKERKKWLESERWRILYLAFFLTTFYLPHTQEMSHISEHKSYTKYTENIYLEEKF